jgi:hypothetical protein
VQAEELTAGSLRAETDRSCALCAANREREPGEAQERYEAVDAFA